MGKVVEEVEAKNVKRGMSFTIFGVECFVVSSKPNGQGSMVIRFLTIDPDDKLEDEYVKTTIPLEILVVPMYFMIELIPSVE